MAQILVFPQYPELHVKFREICRSLEIPFNEAQEISPLEEHFYFVRELIKEIMMIPPELLK